jgi:outer membrane protein OmpA-like peptidoglycan-associated protein
MPILRVRGAGEAQKGITMRITRWPLFAALLLMGATPAFAGFGSKGDWEIGGFGGYGMLDSYGTFEPKNDLFYGGRLGYFISRHLSLEATAQFLPTETPGPLPERAFKINSYRGNAVFNFAVDSKFRPFLTAGGGYENTDIEGFDNSSNFAWNAGGGFRVFLNRRFALRADGRINSPRIDILDQTQNNYEAGLGLSVYFGGEEPEEAPIETTPPTNQPPQISCVTDRAEVMPGENVTITATATDPEGGPITYNWSTSAGSVSGAGTTATLSFDGTTAPSTATVMVQATDDHGNTASSECAVRLVEPARPAEAVSCMAGGFSRNASRLTNVDKACLDDVATRLKSDPRAKVVVIGHADTRETSASRVGDQRASAVRDYLVSTGIERSRITTRSSGSDQLMDTGTDATAQARNRRVVVWFVPEGATLPE